MTGPSALALPGAALPPSQALRRLALLDLVLPFLAIVVLLHNGVAPLAAYAAASLFPAASVVASWAAQRRFDPIGLAVLVGLAGALLTALLTGDPRFALLRAAPAFALFGLACLVSLATKRPLMFFVARALATAGDADRIAAWNERLALPAFRHVMRRLTAAWGAGTLLEAVLGVAVAFLLPASVAAIAEPMTAFAIIGALLAWTRSTQRRARKS